MDCVLDRLEIFFAEMMGGEESLMKRVNNQRACLNYYESPFTMLAVKIFPYFSRLSIQKSSQQPLSKTSTIFNTL